jgi:serine protease Do
MESKKSLTSVSKKSVYILISAMTMLSCLSVFAVVVMKNKLNQKESEIKQTQDNSHFVPNSNENLSSTVQSCSFNYQESYADLVEKLLPAVVNVSSIMSVEEGLDPFSEMDDIFKHFFGGQPRFDKSPKKKQQRKATSLGSGFIIKGNFIITNFHVVKNADKITITTHDNQTIEAVLVGQDEKTDLAVLKPKKLDKATKNLPFLEFGSSESARIGDKILAIGNPFNLGGTVTSGIISAKARNLEGARYSEFLQIDAAINRGNSGGPTFNLKGEVIGVNTAIYTPNGGNIGIGFAIPSDTVKQIIAQISKGESIKRGMIGVVIQPMTKEIADAVGLDSQYGAIVNNVVPNSPAQEAGIQEGDVITHFNSKKITSHNQLPLMVSSTKIGSKNKIKVIRDGKTLELDIVVKEQTDPSDKSKEQEKQQTVLGLGVQDLTPDVVAQLKLAQTTTGVVVVDSKNLGDYFQAGDVITKVKGIKINNVEDFKKVSKEIKPKQAVIVYMIREGVSAVQGVIFK